jgi:hypothetical protein
VTQTAFADNACMTKNKLITLPLAADISFADEWSAWAKKNIKSSNPAQEFAKGFINDTTAIETRFNTGENKPQSFTIHTDERTFIKFASAVTEAYTASSAPIRLFRCYGDAPYVKNSIAIYSTPVGTPDEVVAWVASHWFVDVTI